MRRIAALVLGGALCAVVALADEAPIAGTVKAVNAEARTLLIESTARGKTRLVTVHLKPGGTIMRFVRAAGPGTGGFVEQAIGLADVRPGWIVSVVTRHEGDREVANVVKVVLER